MQESDLDFGDLRRSGGDHVFHADGREVTEQEWIELDEKCGALFGPDEPFDVKFFVARHVDLAD